MGHLHSIHTRSGRFGKKIILIIQKELLQSIKYGYCRPYLGLFTILDSKLGFPPQQFRGLYPAAFERAAERFARPDFVTQNADTSLVVIYDELPGTGGGE